MSAKDYFMELWPLLSDDQKARLVFLAEMMTQFPPPEQSDTATA